MIKRKANTKSFSCSFLILHLNTHRVEVWELISKTMFTHVPASLKESNNTLSSCYSWVATCWYSSSQQRQQDWKLGQTYSKSHLGSKFMARWVLQLVLWNCYLLISPYALPFTIRITRGTHFDFLHQNIWNVSFNVECSHM